MAVTPDVDLSSSARPSNPSDAVAIVGVGLRLAGGVRDVNGLWQALAGERELLGRLPADRFEADRFVFEGGARPGKSYTAAGGFLEDIATFDAEYFGVSPREAAQIDPQQRLLMECAVEAFDDAGVDPATLAGGETAVLMGLSSHDYSDLQRQQARASNPYTMSGIAACNAANRLSYFFDLRGPSHVHDTACSSAMTAVHHACEVLRTGRSPLALAGGASVLLSPAGFVGFSQAGMLSPTGRCKPFSADADGYVRSEGAGVLLLKPLRAALADGDRVHAVIVASGVNADGRTAGLALPSADAQAALLRRVYAGAGFSPRDVAYVEAHGTGTQAGDPIECEALGRWLGRARTDDPLPVGSVKSNVGHHEAASGVVGLLKGVLVLRERRIPATLHADELNPAIDFEGLGLRPVTRGQPLPSTGRGLVGVNSFGFGGANAHVVLAEPPLVPARTPPAAAVLPVLLSAHTPQALSDAALAWAGRFEDPAGGRDAAADFYDAAFTAFRRRARREYRLAALVPGPAEAAAALRSFAAGEVVTGIGSERGVRQGRVGFVFDGNGSQWFGMGGELLRENEAFASEVAAVDASLTPMLGWSVLEELAVPTDRARWARTEVAQPLLFSVQAGLVAALSARGIEAAAVTGHSVGEVAAAYCAGALSREQACRVIAERGRAQAVTAGGGRMAAVGLGVEVAERRLAELGYDDRLTVAGVNSDRDVTIAGEADALAAVGAVLDDEGVFFRDLGLDHAFHSPGMESLQERLKDALSALSPTTCRIPLVSTVTGGVVEGGELVAEYWWRNVREPVLFAHAVRTLTGPRVGCDVLVEIGPHPVLSTYLKRTAADAAHTIATVATLSRTTAGQRALDATHATLLAAGARVDSSSYFPHPGRVVDLPAYPWQRERHWNGSPHWWPYDTPRHTAHAVGHPLLGTRQALAQPAWRQPVEPGALPWLADHTVAGSVVWPAAAYVDMALAAGHEVLDGPVEITGLTISRALTLPFDDPAMDVAVSTTLAADGALTVSSRAGEHASWVGHASGRVRRLLRGRPPALDVDAVRARAGTHLDADIHYGTCTRAGLAYGPAFRTLTALYVGEGEVLAEYAATIPCAPGHRAHPTVLDGALQAGLPLMAGVLEEPVPFLPVGIATVRCRQPMPGTGLVHVRARTITAHQAQWDVTVTDTGGEVVLELLGCRFLRFEAGRRPEPQRLTEVLRAAPLLGSSVPASPLPSPAEVQAASADALAGLTARWRAENYADVRALGMTVIGHFTAAALTQLLPHRDTFTLPDLAEAGVLGKHIPLLRVLCATAVDQGLLTDEEPGRWRLRQQPDPALAMREFLRHMPGHAVSGVTYAACGKHLASVLRGETNPIELLFSETDMLAARFYEADAATQYHGAMAARLVAAAVKDWPQDRPLRILEVGAGTGGTTGLLLPHLPPDRTQYVFSDVSPAFFPAAASRFAAYDFVEYRTLDLNADPVAQGFAHVAFDLVIAANVLHATNDLAETLHRIADLLADGGQLLAQEVHALELLAPVFGLLDSFWTVSDAGLRPEGPLLARDEWPPLLDRCGFRDTVQFGDTEEPARGDHSLFLTTRSPRPGTASPDPTAGKDTKSAGARRWLITGGTENTARLRGLETALRDQGAEEVRTVAAPDDTALTASPATDIIVLIEAKAAGCAAQETAEAARHLRTLAGVSRTCAERADDIVPTLWLVIWAPPNLLSPPPLPGPAAAAWGAARTLANEQPGMTVRRVQLASASEEHEEGDPLRALVRELLSDTSEDEVLLTPAGRFVTRVRPLPPATPAPRTSGFTLALENPGLHYRLGWKPADPPAPGEGEVVVAINAAALNYHDIMIATGRIPAQPSTRRPDVAELGLECAGVVSAVGPGVKEWSPGDRVVGMALGCFGSHALARADRLLPLPEGVAASHAVTMHVVFLTAHHSLGHLARLAPGETLLVHGAAGGVGLAALQYAHTIGARVIATAGTPVKRDVLRLLGAEHVLDSRSLDFAEQVMDLTDGRGVDVVLNSLAGEALVRSVNLLAPHGRFLELGKRDFLADSPLPLGPFLHNLSFFGVDASTLFEQTSALADAHLAAIAKNVKTGHYAPLPHRCYPAHRIDEAFTCLQHSRHIGKIVVIFGEDVPVHQAPEPLRLDPEATYLITGGLGGFGAATARHLATRGARHLTLVSRRGAHAPEAAALMAELQALGTEVSAHACDVTDEARLRRALAAIDASGRRLGGVVHGAMVLDDADLSELTDDRLHAVLAPKMTAGRLLDQLTRDRALDFFVVHSSVAALVGNVKQAPYAAANLALEALVRERRHQGLPALAVQWGALAGAGFVHRTGRAEELAALGLSGLSTEHALTELDQLLTRSDAPVVALGHMDWTRLYRILPGLAAPRTASLIPDHHDTEAADSFRDALASATPDEALALVEDTLADLLAFVLQTAPERIDRTRRLEQLGVDSLMTAELAHLVQQRIGCDLPLMELTGMPHLTALAARILVLTGYGAESESR